MSITLKLDGLHCGNCVKSVEKALNAVEGVTKATVTLDPQQAIVEGSANAETLIAAVDDIGFEAEVI
ncbi:heavy-metal-associated domain-containing protein [Actinobacillus pleuropneumoniae]|uniref:Cation transport ATPase n=1 Tax=Actinobacillus pleuropneumoniae serotype 7 (strain AP76) TaxID=537457 RepID=B3H236_ACTP7|nr:cation transporter [Actinobacillus pleuropneumoniae]ACE61966.1 Putative cation transport ATPase [Actinobacillus pleuropneumoniae serovar 7 str. AP76]EFN02532.1 Cation transport ATPase [Actinobacillus pleuropneumoniae serovar 13 str. N273]UKH39400.1 heavy-metal-associated domain-containing protein [Actinobacillus pleuropneumoniae]UQZ25009.1 cation transporter [Actinobacillus pleuropneumoniae]